jgi:hypothetical protein
MWAPKETEQAEIDLELAKLGVLCRRYEAQDKYHEAIPDDTIRNWKNKREYVV